MRKYRYGALILVLIVALCAGCSLLAPAEANPSATPAATPQIVHAQLATPEITYSEPYVTPMPEGAAAPAAYTRVKDGALPEGVALFAFTDTTGDLAYRVYAVTDELSDGAKSGTVEGYYSADAAGTMIGTEPAVLADEPMGQCTPLPLPTDLRLKTTYTAAGPTGLLSSTDPAHPGYVVYGAFELDDSGEGGAFYPAGSDGAMIPGALPIDYSVTVPAYTPAEKPAKDGERKLVVYIGTQTVVCYQAVNGEWTEERVMICSTGRRKDMTPRGDFAIMKQYLYKKMGEVQGVNVYSQYASRITGSYLFHSVPIGGKYRERPSYGVKQMFVKYYHQLGSVASGGCVRLLCKDAFWIYVNCETGTPVTITDDEGPAAPEIPALIEGEPYMDKRGDYGWDPTDPNPENPYHAIYEPEFVLNGEVADKSDKDYADGSLDAYIDEADTAF